MKNERGVLIIGVVIGMCAFCLLNSLVQFGNVIKRDGTVKEIKYWGIVAEDCTGRNWAYHTDEGFQIGERVKIQFDCNNTLDNYTDDKLLKITLDK